MMSLLKFGFLTSLLTSRVNELSQLMDKTISSFYGCMVWIGKCDTIYINV